MVLKKLLTMYHRKYEVSHARRGGLHAFLFVTRKIIKDHKRNRTNCYLVNEN